MLSRADPLLHSEKGSAHQARRIMQTDMGRVCRVSTPDGERNTAGVTGTAQAFQGAIGGGAVFIRPDNHTIPAAAGSNPAFKTFEG
ncbi:MAG TPA: hypothetical protein DCM39_16840 [Pantoea sp.]|nr:hypothetical protein [Pantoea sp.]